MSEFKAANGKHTTNGIPHGNTSITPHIAVEPAERAIAMYAEVFGARIADVMRMGKIVGHAVLDFPSGRITLSDPLPAYQLIAPDSNGVTYSLGLYVP
ncbi:MAG TPA: hypothetical protein VIV60_27340, partial [Polyangiaceae bacterium]